ncbi:ABC transporter permease subunit [Yaniella flava]|uniref:ABC transporter permease subunit n=1 Tax=Yaniella flava TaxID=287930 RepID=A0ABN2UD05_9MICC
MTWVLENLDVILRALGWHIVLSVPAIVAALLCSIPLGWLAHRLPRLSGPIITGSGLLFAIPSLPLLIILPVITGAGLRDGVNVVIALTLYGIALLVRSVADGFNAISSQTRLAATALGYSAVRRFLTVDLPLAAPVILTGLRVVTASTIALCTVGAVLGIPSLGTLFTDGFQRQILAEILVGIVLTLGLAGALDGLLLVTGKLLLPWRKVVA